MCGAAMFIFISLNKPLKFPQAHSRIGCEGFLMFWELTPSPSSRCSTGGLVPPKLMTRCPPHHQAWCYQTTDIRWKFLDGVTSRMLENLHTLTQLSAQENFIKFCHCKSLKTYKYWSNCWSCILSIKVRIRVPVLISSQIFCLTSFWLERTEFEINCGWQVNKRMDLQIINWCPRHPNSKYNWRQESICNHNYDRGGWHMLYWSCRVPYCCVDPVAKGYKML